MPNFNAHFILGEEAPWVDTASATRASRLNADPEHLHSHRKYVLVGGTVSVQFRAIVGGVDAPLDAALGGNLFTAAWVEWSGSSQPAMTQNAGQSSVVYITATAVGHYCVSFTRTNGGGMLVHFDVEE